MKNLDKQQIQNLVQAAYGQVARNAGKPEQSCGCGCGSGSIAIDPRQYARSLGYTDEELGAIPASSNLALSCGNPGAIAALKPGETVLDLGSGAGFDCFLASAKVGAEGRVIGVDMTQEMIDGARANAAEAGTHNVEFHLGEIEALPVEDDSIDVVISNCVINLSADKGAVFREIGRVLKPGGRVAISDIVLLKELPEAIQGSIAAYAGCIGGAVGVEKYRRFMEDAGLETIEINISPISLSVDEIGDPFGQLISESLGEDVSFGDYVASAEISARRT